MDKWDVWYRTWDERTTEWSDEVHYDRVGAESAMDALRKCDGCWVIKLELVGAMTG